LSPAFKAAPHAPTDAVRGLIDEHGQSLDVTAFPAIMEVLARIAKDPSRSVLVVTHDPRTVPFADRIVRIEDGRIVGEQRFVGEQRSNGGQISVIEGRKAKRKRMRSLS